MEALIRAMMSAGARLNRPPHIEFVAASAVELLPASPLARLTAIPWILPMLLLKCLRRSLAAVLIAVALPAAAAEELADKFTKLEAPAPAPQATFQDAEGKDVGLDAFRGKWVLLNFWATWCAPCRAEMKDLDELQAKLGGDRFVVVAVSGDRQGLAVVQEFYREIGVERLGQYVDKTMKSARAFRAIGLPTTILIDPEGREVGRAVGPIAWASPASLAHLRGLIAAGG